MPVATSLGGSKTYARERVDGGHVEAEHLEHMCSSESQALLWREPQGKDTADGSVGMCKTD